MLEYFFVCSECYWAGLVMTALNLHYTYVIHINRLIRVLGELYVLRVSSVIIVTLFWFVFISLFPFPSKAWNFIRAYIVS